MNTMLIRASLGLAVLAAGFGASAATPQSYEEARAHIEEARIIASPIAGVRNSLWFDYRINVTEAQKELATDLRNAKRFKHERRAWDEYAHELHGERVQYIAKMAKRGYRYAVVTVEDE